ncbi:MAG: metalloregulator ArsR/SmtB family transcription factor [Gordonibacter sp.]
MDAVEKEKVASSVPREAGSHDGGCGCGCANHAGADGMPECMPDEELLYDLADLFKVFGDTTRIKILYALMGQQRCVADIAELIGATQSAVSHQLRTLKQARLVKFQRDGKNVIYSLSDDHVHTMIAQGMSHICE